MTGKSAGRATRIQLQLSEVPLFTQGYYLKKTDLQPATSTHQTVVRSNGPTDHICKAPRRKGGEGNVERGATSGQT